MTNMEKLKRAASAKPKAKAGLTCLACGAGGEYPLNATVAEIRAKLMAHSIEHARCGQ